MALHQNCAKTFTMEYHELEELHACNETLATGVPLSTWTYDQSVIAGTVPVLPRLRGKACFRRS